MSTKKEEISSEGASVLAKVRPAEPETEPDPPLQAVPRVSPHRRAPATRRKG
jgi:hypothetical protein